MTEKSNPEPKRGAVPAAISETAEVAEMLADQSQTLAKRLESVLQSPSSAAESGPDEEEVCPAATDIRKIKEVLKVSSAIIADILVRLEI